MWQRCLLPIFPVPPELAGEDLSFTGHQLPPEIARAVAAGDLDPCTRLPFDAQPEGPMTPALDAAMMTTAPTGAGSSSCAAPPPGEAQGTGAASPAVQQPPLGGMGGRQSKITSLFGPRAAAPAKPFAVARAGPLPTVSEFALRDFRPPRQAGEADIDARPASETRDASPPSAGPGCDDEASGAGPVCGPQPPALKRVRGWTANPFAPAAKRMATAAAANGAR